MVGKVLAHYQILERIGKGGMGEVYRGRDTKLDRDVALKILPPELSGDPERAARFHREARSLAMLQHPNVASIYGFEEVDGLRFLVMELVEGEDLSRRLARGPVAIDEAVRIAQQIVAGLEAAHLKGIVHRDLKPANVMLTPDGDVKVLDFGLARAWFGEAENGGDIETSPTITAAMTQAGTILGTAAYMSPEQARGRNVDQRADIWALGVITWEMLTGTKLFDGDTVSDVLAAVLRVDPQLDDLPPATPRSLRKLLGHCLQKDPRRRMHSIADVGILLGEVGAREDASTGTRPGTPSRWRPLPWAIALLAIAALLWKTTRPGDPPSEVSPARFSLQLPDPIHSQSAGSITLSPDGRVLAVVIRPSGSLSTELWLRKLDREEFRRVDGIENPGPMTFSPDSQWLLFRSEGRIRKLRIADGTVIDLATGDALARAAWLEDGTIIYTQNYASGLFRLHEDGGAIEELTTAGPGELGHWYAESIPGSRYILYTSYTTPIDSARIMALDTQTLASKPVMHAGSDPRYAPSGHLLFLRGGQWMAAPFDPSTAEVTGAVVPVLDDIIRGGYDGFTALDLSDNGTLVWIHESEYALAREVVRIHRDGSTEVLAIAPRRFGNLALSPDGRRLAIPIEEETVDLWIHDLERSTQTRFSFGSTSEFCPVWTPDGQTIFYAVDSPQFVIRRQDSSASTPSRVVVEDDADVLPNCVTPDGKFLIYHRSDPNTQEDLWMLPLKGGEAQLLIQTPFEEYGASVSPDGKWLVYHSDESGRIETYVRSFPTMTSRIQVSQGGGHDARWSADGTELTYISPQGFSVVAFSVENGDVHLGEARVIYSGEMDGDSLSPVYDTFPDGSGWIFTRVPEGKRLRSVHVETGWMQRVLADAEN